MRTRRRSTRVPAALVRAYRDTDFVVDAPRIVIRIGEASLRLDRLLRQHGARRWAFITAWNPGSRRASSRKNAAGNRSLLSLLRRRGHLVLRGEGRPRKPGWRPEASFLVLDIDAGEALALGRRFGQVAIVTGRLESAARLRYC